MRGQSRIEPKIHTIILYQLVWAEQWPNEEIGHDLLDRAPLARMIQRDKVVKRAVTNILNTRQWKWDDCCHIHHNNRSTPGNWHCDDYDGLSFEDYRRFAIVCYSPQDTTMEMGPTSTRGGDCTEGPAGTFIVFRPDIEHRAMANISGKRRVMLKFLASRL